MEKNLKKYIFIYTYIYITGGSDVKEYVRHVGNLASVPGLGRFSGGGHGNPLKYSCLENPMDRGA